MAIQINKISFNNTCPICGSRRSVILFPDTLKSELPSFDYNFGPAHSRTYQIIKCLDCSHGYTSSVPHNVFQNYQDIQDYVYLKNEKQRIETANKVIKDLVRHAPTGRLLDIGCATGDFLSVASKYYWVEGLELSNWSANIAKSKGFIVHTCKLESLSPSYCFDVITLWGVIEHFQNPHQEIAHIYRLLTAQGIVSLWTGDITSILSYVLGKKWWWIQGQHIQLFSKRSLRKLFLENGFEEIKVGLYPYTTTMQSLSNSLRRYPFITKLTEKILNNKYLSNMKVTFRLPGEMFAIFRKKEN